MYETYDECRARIFGATEEEKVGGGNAERHNAIINSDSGTLGVRVPVIKRLAKAVPIACRDAVLSGFFGSGDTVFETVLFAGVLAARKGDYRKTREYMKRLIPMFSSWAHPDTIVPCLRWTDEAAFRTDFSYLLDCEGQYEVRTYIIYLMTRCIESDLDFALDTLINKVKYGQYYVDMAAAWCVAEALVKNYEGALPTIEKSVLPPFVHNKAIQKARESFRLTDERKAQLSSLRAKIKDKK
ncbi:MAG: hypothetical protein J1G38_01690 [Clostridiales bacterium]|nr:hypothetical protein [Clostridiales bacterium]